MSNIASMVERLVLCGADPGIAAAIVAEAFTAGVACAPERKDDTAERRREKDRARKQEERERERERLRISAESADIADVVPSPASPSSSPLTLSLITTPSPPASKDKRERGSRLAQAWEPSDPSFAGSLLGPRAETELARFRDHWAQASGANAVKRDWDAAWRNWCRTAAERGGTGPPGNVSRFPQPARNTAYEAAQQIRDSLAAAQPEPPACGGSGNDDDRVFQAGERGLSPPLGDGDYLNAGPVSARGY